MFREFRNIVLLFFLCCFAQFSLLVLCIPDLFAGECPDNLASYWYLDDTSAPYQDIASSNSGTCSVQCPASGAGIIGGAQFFNGIDAGINVPAASEFDWSSDSSFTIEFWLQRSANNFFGPEIILGRDDGQNSSLQWWIAIDSAGSVQFSLTDQSGSGPIQAATGNTSIVDGYWHHIVITRDGVTSQTQLFVDGALDSSPQIFSYSAGFQSATAAINIGWLESSAFADQNYGGGLDELAIYNGVLSDFEIWQHSNDGSEGLGLGYCFDGTPIRIMPLGDSITAGTSTTIDDSNYLVGYRQQLFNTLESFGYSVDFVGGENTGSLAMPPFDSDHEGHPIWTAAEVAANVYSWLVANPADVVLLHVGTNNVSTDTSDVEFLLDEIDRYSEDIIVLLARIINRQSHSATTTTFNNNIEAMAAARVEAGDKIIMVDQEGALLYPNDINDDNLHPTVVGYEKMAETWFAALERFLPIANPLPVLKFSNDIVTMEANQGYFPQSQTVSLDTLDGLPANFTITSDSAWLEISTDETTTPSSVTFSLNDNTLSAGVYTAYATASSPEYVDAVIKVTLILTTENSDFQLYVSTLPDHSGAQLLEGNILAGDVYVFMSPETDVTRVDFYLDHEFQRRESVAPFDFAGNDPYNLMHIANGEHEITAIITISYSQKEVISSTFTVSNLLSSLTVDSSNLTFSSIEGALPSDQTVNIDTSDSSATNFSVSTNVDWLAVSPSSGLSPATVTVSVTDTTLAPGVYTASIIATADDYNSSNVSVEYTVANSGDESAYSLLFSTSPDRSGAVTLNSTTVSGDIYVFTGPDTDVKSVTFSLDGTVVQREGVAPFDFAGTATANTPNPYDTTQLGDGQHEISALITLTDGSSEVISSTFIVNNNIPALTTDVGSILFEALEGGLPVDQLITLDTSDSLATDFSLSSDVSWLTVSPSNSTTPSMVTLSINDSTLAPGVYNATITAAAGGYASVTVDVSYTVSSIEGNTYSLLLSSFADRSGAVTLDSSTVSGDIFVFTGPDDDVKSVTFSLDGTVVQREGVAPFDFAGTATATTPNPYDTTQLGDGQHEISALITLTDGSSEVISGIFTVYNNIPALTVDTVSILFEALEGDIPVDQVFSLGTSDGLAADFSISTDVSWMEVSPANGTTPALVTVSITDATLSPGVYDATITAVAGGYANTVVNVSYTVTGVGGSGYSLLVSSSSDRSNALTLDSSTVTGDIYVFTGPDSGVRSVTFSLDGTAVLTEGYGPFDFAGTATSTTANPYDTTQLGDGQHEISALITLTDGSSEVISGTFTVYNNIPALTVDTASILFEALEGDIPVDQVFNLGTSDGLAADFSISTDASWLAVSPINGTSLATVTVSVNDSTLVPGVYNATITATATGYVDASVNVNYTVSSIGGSAYSLLFSTFSDRSGATVFDNVAVSGDIYVFTSPDTDVKRVTFSLDGTELITESYAPFDFAGTASGGAAIPYDTTQLTNGLHEISALIELNNGDFELINNSFTVLN